MDDKLDISEVVRRTGLTSRTLRFYETKGLLQPLRTHKGRRLYGPQALERIDQIVALKRAGFTLGRIETVLAENPPDLPRLIDAQMAALALRQQEIVEAMALLCDVSARLERGETIDVETFCALIRRADLVTQRDAWAREAVRQLSDEEPNKRLAGRMWAILSPIDPEDHKRRRRAFYTRVEAMLPLDLDSAEARMLVDEWRALNEPLMAIGRPGPVPPIRPEEADNAQARIAEWNRAANAPTPPKVFAFLFTATRHHMRGEVLQ